MGLQVKMMDLVSKHSFNCYICNKNFPLKRDTKSVRDQILLRNGKLCEICWKKGYKFHSSLKKIENKNEKIHI